MTEVPTTVPTATEAPPPRRWWSRRRGVPPAMRGAPYASLALFLLVVALVRQYGDFGLGDQDLINTWLFYSVIVVGFYFVFGVSGQFAFSQAAFAAVGGYTSAWATREALFGTDTFWMGLVVGVAVAAVLAAVFAYFMRRASEFYLAIATLGLSSIFLDIIQHWDSFTGTTAGTTSGIRPITFFGYEINQLNGYQIFWVWLGAFAIVMLIAIWLARSPVQRESIAMRDQHQVAASLGVPVLKHRISMFVLGSAIAAAAGAVYVHVKGFASPDSFDINLGIAVFVILIVGGIDSRWGAVLGAAFYVFVPQWLQGGVLGISGINVTIKVFGQEHRFGDFRDIFFGAVLVITMIAFPEGLVGVGRRLRALTLGQIRPERRTWLSDLIRLTPKGGRRRIEPAASGPPLQVKPGAGAREPSGAEVLDAKDISVTFGGVRAVVDVSLTLHDGEILGLVGPNGSGKTTFLNALSGVVDALGTLTVLGTDVRLGRPGRMRELGVLRTFQAPQTYDHLTCLEDVLLSTSDRHVAGMLSAWFARVALDRHERRRWDEAMATLDRVGLADLADDPTSRLSYGQRRMLELARAINAHPRALVLDEPSAGLNATETEQLAMQLQRLKGEGVPIRLVDHKLDFITSICDRVAVFELGRLVAIGEPDAVFADQRVIDAYLGVDELAHGATLTDGEQEP
jgi:ABC-type branched-subunit amino acid transport system ATPase component/ABC-type branched-subunit amino acid transport system permease subunit